MMQHILLQMHFLQWGPPAETNIKFFNKNSSVFTKSHNMKQLKDNSTVNYSKI